jgi:hypothetical protein
MGPPLLVNIEDKALWHLIGRPKKEKKNSSQTLHVLKTIQLMIFKHHHCTMFLTFA